MPNMDAVKFLYENIMPLVWAKDASIKINILGPDFPEEINNNIIQTASVFWDIRKVLITGLKTQEFCSTAKIRSRC